MANLGSSMIVHIVRAYNNADNECYTFAISIKHNNLASITQLSGIATSRLITKIRIARTGNTALAVDLYYNGTAANSVAVSGEGFGTFQNPTAISDTTSTFVEFDTVGNSIGALATSGAIVSTSDQTISSDATLKTNLSDIKYTVEDIAHAPAITFD